jgi:4-hydroxy-tetrahydrodipicolinate reductase
MNPIKIMVNGIPGKVATTIARHILKDNRFELIRRSLTGPEIQHRQYQLDHAAIGLVTPSSRERDIESIKAAEGAFISVDFTLPAAANENAAFYCRHSLPFVMGTTGGDRDLLEKTVQSSSICAVIAPNMAKQIVGFQAMMKFAADNFPGLFDGYRLEIKESHQQSKVDTSGTAKAMVQYFNRLGLKFSEHDIVKIRDPKIQKEEWKIPEAYLDGHGWHTYTITSADGTVQFAFTHNVNGRDIYSYGTVDAVLFLSRKIASGQKGVVFSMMDVLKGFQRHDG